MPGLSGNIFFNAKSEPKTILYPTMGKKQDAEFVNLITKQFSTNCLLEARDENDELVGYYVADANMKRDKHGNLTNGDDLTLEVTASFVRVDIEPVNFDYDLLVELNEIARHMFEESGVYGVKFGGQLDYILNASLYPPRGVEYPMTILERAAFYWVRIATKQAYNNGNKRTALLSALTYLDANGYLFDEISLEKATGKDMYKITVDIANGKLDEEKIYDLLFEHSSIKLFDK